LAFSSMEKGNRQVLSLALVPSLRYCCKMLHIAVFRRFFYIPTVSVTSIGSMASVIASHGTCGSEKRPVLPWWNVGDPGAFGASDY